IVQLIKKCLDADPLNRPTANKIKENLRGWCYEPSDELQKQVKEAEDIDINNHLLNYLPTSIKSSTNLELSYETHSEAIYASRLLNYKNLPEPKNSDDYYKQNDNIISEKYSGIEYNLSISKVFVD